MPFHRAISDARASASVRITEIIESLAFAFVEANSNDRIEHLQEARANCADVLSKIDMAIAAETEKVPA